MMFNTNSINTILDNVVINEDMIFLQDLFMFYSTNLRARVKRLELLEDGELEFANEVADIVNMSVDRAKNVLEEAKIYVSEEEFEEIDKLLEFLNGISRVLKVEEAVYKAAPQFEVMSQVMS